MVPGSFWGWVYLVAGPFLGGAWYVQGEGRGWLYQRGGGYTREMGAPEGGGRYIRGWGGWVFIPTSCTWDWDLGYQPHPHPLVLTPSGGTSAVGKQVVRFLLECFLVSYICWHYSRHKHNLKFLICDLLFRPLVTDRPPCVLNDFYMHTSFLCK